MQHVFLLRHCQSTGEQPDGDLTAKGRQQAIELVPRIRALGPDAMFSSPYRRAVGSIAPSGTALGLKIITDDRLKERLLKPVGVVLPDWQDHVRRSFDDRDYALAGGESLNQTSARAMAALLQVMATGHQRPVVAAHGNLIASVLGELDQSFGFVCWQEMKMPHVYRLGFEGGRFVEIEDLG
jgi:2,3-bisphosphoglycerate-dependent phosphoglycerate mutase